MHGRTLQVIALHTRWPVLPELQVARDRALQQAAALALTRPDSTILLGDLNLTPYAPAFARLVSESGLRDALAGEAWRPTWQAGFWPLALPIDHVLVPRRACVTGQEIGPTWVPITGRCRSRCACPSGDSLVGVVADRAGQACGAGCRLSTSRRGSLSAVPSAGARAAIGVVLELAATAVGIGAADERQPRCRE